MRGSLEVVGQKFQQTLNVGKVDAYVESGWELWQISVLGDSSGGSNGVVLIYRRPKQG